MRIRRIRVLFCLPIFGLLIICKNMHTSKTKLNYLVRRPKIETENPPLLILLHGVGSNEKNMFSFAEYLPEKYLIVSARGPLDFGNNSYAWFQVDFSTGKPVIVESQAEAARKVIIEFIDDLQSELNFDKENIYLMGFSQGGIMSYSVALTTPEKVKGIAVMSGRLLPEVKPLIAENTALTTLKVYISHGYQDPVLQYGFAEDAVNYLQTKGLHPEFHSYHAGHTINQEMLNDVIEWLK